MDGKTMVCPAGQACSVQDGTAACVAPLPPPSPSPPPSAPSPPPAASPSPSPPSPRPTASSSSSSAPIGAIAGGIGAAVAVVAVLAFFALRPGQGWLRNKRPAATEEDGSSGKEPPTPSSSAAAEGTPRGGKLYDGGISDQPQGINVLLAMASGESGSALGPNTLLPYSRVRDGNLTSSDQHQRLGSAKASGTPSRQPLGGTHSGAPTANSAGLHNAVAAAAVAPAPSWSTSRSISTLSPDSDVVLSFISSYLGSHRPPAGQLASATPSGGMDASPSGGSGAIELHSENRMWEVQWEELTILRMIGHGSYGSVYLAEWKQTPVAVKVLVGKESIKRGQLELPDKVVRDLQAEAAVMSRMRHPNVVQFMGLVALPPALIAEYCGRGSLYECLAAAREHPTTAAQLTWRLRLAMAVDAGTGLLYLHSRNIIHRDVKSPNLLVDDHWRVKVADFNLSKLLEGARPESSLTSTGGVTNPMWLAPEVMADERPTDASDVFSFGMVLYELLTWRLPWNFAQVSPFKVAATVKAGGRPEVPPREALPGPDTAGWAGLDDYVQLMRDCWAQQQSDRPSFDEVVGRLRRLLGDAP